MSGQLTASLVFVDGPQLTWSAGSLEWFVFPWCPASTKAAADKTEGRLLSSLYSFGLRSRSSEPFAARETLTLPTRLLTSALRTANGRFMRSRDPHWRMLCALEPRMARMGLLSLSAYIPVIRG
jgi:hypothetical protein